MTDIVKINPQEFGLEETKAAQIAEQFKPMLDKMVELEIEANEVFSLPIEDAKTAKKAKEVRLKYVKVRTGTAEIHKQQKAFYLQAGRFIDGWKNAQLFASQGVEERLEAIEKYAETKEKERIAAIKSKREVELSPYCENVSMFPLGEMSDEAYNQLLAGQKLSYEAKVAAQKRAEEERIAREQEEIKGRDRIRVENERLKAEAEERENALREEIEKAEKEKRAIEEAARREREEAERLLKEEMAKAEEEARRIREEQEKKLSEERKERERIERELKAKKDAEYKAMQEAEAAAEAEAAKGDAEKYQDFIKDIELLTQKYQFKSKKFRTAHSAGVELLNKTINYLISKQ